MFLTSLFCPNNLWRFLKSAGVLISSLGINFPPFVLSAILTNWVAVSSNILNLVKGNSGVFVNGFIFTFLTISSTIKSKSASVSLTLLDLAYLSNVPLTALTLSIEGL